MIFCLIYKILCSFELVIYKSIPVMKTQKYIIFLLFFLFFIFAFFLWEFKSINVNNRQNVSAVESTTRFSKNLNQLQFSLLKLDNNFDTKALSGQSGYAFEFRNDSAAAMKLFNDASFTGISDAGLTAGLLKLKNSTSEKLLEQSEYLLAPVKDSAAIAGYLSVKDRQNRALNAQLLAVNNLQQKLFAGEIGKVENTYTKQYLIALGFAVLSFLVFYFLLTGLNSHVQRRKQAEQQALINEQRYKNIIDESGAIIFTTDMDGRFTFVNEMASRVTGYMEEELLGKTYLELVHPVWQQQVVEFYAQSIRKSEVQTQIKFPVNCKNGEIKWVEQTAVIVTQNGIPAGFHCVTKDITESYQLERGEKIPVPAIPVHYGKQPAGDLY